MRRQPPIGTIQSSDPVFLTVNSTVVQKVGPVGWNCTAVIEPSTSRTCFTVENLADSQNGVGIAVFDPERNVLRGSGSSGFPNPNHWGADCLVGIYGTGSFFNVDTSDHPLCWYCGLTVEVAMKLVQGEKLIVEFVAEGPDGKCSGAHKELSPAPEVVKLAVALYTPEDKVSIESVW